MHNSSFYPDCLILGQYIYHYETQFNFAVTESENQDSRGCFENSFSLERGYDDLYYMADLVPNEKENSDWFP